MDEKIFRRTRIQIGVLRNRGLVIKNKKRARIIIRDVNYYNLINGYKDPFLINNLPYEKYIDGTRFEEIYALYEFDRKLRIITLEYILEVEKMIKSHIAYTFSQKYGHKNYLRIENFDSKGIHKYKQVCDLLSSLYKKINMNIDKDLSITHYVDGKNYIPLWVLVNSISMGDISKFYSNMHQTDRVKVARSIKWGIRENQLASCLFFLSSIRNRCAHDERLYSYLSYVNLCNNKFFKYFNNISNTKKYFAAMVAFKMILSKERYIQFQNQFEEIFNELSAELETIPIKKIREIMGLPNNWRKLKKL